MQDINLNYLMTLLEHIDKQLTFVKAEGQNLENHQLVDIAQHAQDEVMLARVHLRKLDTLGE